MFFPHFCLSLPCGQLFPIYSPASQHRKGRAGHAGDRRHAVHLVVEVREDPRGLLERREHHLPVHRQACADIRPFGRKMSYRIMSGTQRLLKFRIVADKPDIAWSALMLVIDILAFSMYIKAVYILEVEDVRANRLNRGCPVLRGIVSLPC